MAKAVSKEIQQIIKDFGLNPDPNASDSCIWDCHDTWVMYHKYIEQAAATVGIETNLKQVLVATDNTVALVVEGTNGDRHEWATGEASPKNNKNAYPWAMAEKRAKDRVILKLIGLTGHIYSDVDIADKNAVNKNGKPAPFDEIDPWDEWKDTAISSLSTCQDEESRQLWLTMYKDELKLCYTESKANGQLVNQKLESTKKALEGT